jgi:hypothetical protein
MNAQTNLFTNSSGDESWMNTANWSLGVIPTSSHDVTMAVGQLARVPSGSNAEARSVSVGTDSELVLAVNSTLEVVEMVSVVFTGKITNRGNLILLAGNSGIDISVGGGLINHDTIYIYSPDVGIDFSSGRITNNELIVIDNASIGAINMYTAGTFPNQRHFLNNAGGTIEITNPDGYGIWLSDTLTNYGEIHITNVDRDHPNVPAEGIYIGTSGKCFNHGGIDITISEDHCLRNNGGTFKNEPDGVIDLSAFQDIGFLNEFLSDNYGTINIECTVNTANNKGIHLVNGMTNRSGGTINIYGNDLLETGMEIDQTFTNEAGATLNIERYLERGIIGDGGGTYNYGTIYISDVNDLLAYGFEAFSFVHNYGTIHFEDMGSGIRNYTSAFNNYGMLQFHNLLSKAIFSERKFTNHADGTILIYNDDGTRISWGITMIDEISNQDFINNGSILMDSVHVGLDLRIGEFVNNGLCYIDHYRYGVDFGTFYDPAIFTNNDRLILRNHEEPLTYSITLEGGDPGTYNFINHDTATLEISNAYRGLSAASGFKNEGIMEFNDIAEKAIYLNNATAVFNCYNASTGRIIIDTAQYGMYFGSGGTANQISFTNEGNISFNHIDEYAISGENTLVSFINEGGVMGNTTFDCDYFLLNGDILPGNSPGYMVFDAYQADDPWYFIELKGYAGAGYPNGHDGILIPASFMLTGHLYVDTINGFSPVLDDEFTIMLSGGTITGTFQSTSFPDLGPNLQFQVVYEPDRVKLKVIPKYTIWSGAIGTSWNNANNWQGGSVPDEHSFVIITGSAPNFPLITNGVLSIGSNAGTHKCRRLEIGPGASMNLVNTMLEIYDLLTITGSFNFFTNGSHQVHVYPNADIQIDAGAELSLNEF